MVVATYCQQIFDAVPLILVSGPKGSGKTELSSAISKVCANSPGPIGLISAATLTRLVDSSHGFVAIDDLEKIMSKRGDDAQFSDLAQALKLSYKKESAQRMLTDVNGDNQIHRLNFFGIKLINNTRGVDEILGSRMLKISTRQMPAGEKLARDGRLDSEQCAQLRDHLHVWAFSHVGEIARTYAEIFPDVSTRDAEIYAPIRVVARLSGSESFALRVDEALGSHRESSTTTATEAMGDALLSIVTSAIASSQRLPIVVSVLEAQMRLRLREGRRSGDANASDMADIDSPEWIGRQFKDTFAPIGAESIRFEMHGRASRFYPLNPELLAKAIAATNTERAELVEDSNPRAFCSACSGCDYLPVCEIRPQKLRADARMHARPREGVAPAEKPVGGKAGLH